MNSHQEKAVVARLLQASKSLDLWRAEYEKHQDRSALRNYAAALYHANAVMLVASADLGLDHFSGLATTLSDEIRRLPPYAPKEKEHGNE